MSLTCPKCHGAMRSYERNGVTIDQCTECRGIFLDRGELEHLVDAEDRWHADDARSAAAPQAPGQGQYQGQYQGQDQRHSGGPSGGLGGVVNEVLRQAGQSRSGHSSSYGSSSGYPQKRKKSFLDELFG